MGMIEVQDHNLTTFIEVIQLSIVEFTTWYILLTIINTAYHFSLGYGSQNNLDRGHSYICRTLPLFWYS